MRICLIGTGSIAQDHIDAFNKIGEVEFDTVVSRLQESADAFAEANGFTHTSTDFDSALRMGNFDAVVICSPSNLHAAQTESALNADKHVLVEIPVATQYTDAQRVSQLADAKGKTVMVAHTQRFFQPLIEVKRRIDAGEFHLHHFVASWFFLRRENVNWRGRRRSWTDNLLWHHGCHVVEVALWLLGTENVDASGMMSRPSDSLKIPLDLNVTMRTGSGQIATISMSYNAHWSIHQYVLIGDEDTLIYRGGKLESQAGAICETQESPMILQNREFLAAVRENRPPSVSAWSVLPTMRVLQSVQIGNPHILPADALL